MKNIKEMIQLGVITMQEWAGCPMGIIAVNVISLLARYALFGKVRWHVRKWAAFQHID